MKFSSSAYSHQHWRNRPARKAWLVPLHEHHWLLPTLEICFVHASFHIRHHRHGTKSQKQNQIRSWIILRSKAILPLPWPRIETVLPSLRSLHLSQFPLLQPLRHRPLQNLQRFGSEIVLPANNVEVGGGDRGPGPIPASSYLGVKEHKL